MSSNRHHAASILISVCSNPSLMSRQHVMPVIYECCVLCCQQQQLTLSMCRGAGAVWPHWGGALRPLHPRWQDHRDWGWRGGCHPQGVGSQVWHMHRHHPGPWLPYSRYPSCVVRPFLFYILPFVLNEEPVWPCLLGQRTVLDWGHIAVMVVCMFEFRARNLSIVRLENQDLCSMPSGSDITHAFWCCWYCTLIYMSQ